MPHAPVLAIDLGGTKLAAALVDGPQILDRREIPTDRRAGAAAWIASIIRLVEGWHGFRTAGAAVTGLVSDGLWRALNPETLPVPDDFPLVAMLREGLGVPVIARNDAQAAAWGEYRCGGLAGDMVFVTVSTGIGGGIVAGGRLLDGRTGLAGHIGITPVATPQGVRLLEELASGRALGRLSRAEGGAPAVAAAAQRGEARAAALMDDVVAPLALALRRLQLELDPERIVIGGGLGLAPGYIDRLRRHLEPVPALLRPRVCAAALGADAGLIGIADLAITPAEFSS